MGEFTRLACRPDVLRRALVYAVVVGAILIAINHGDPLLAGDLDGHRAVKFLLTLLVPFCVSIFSSAGAVHSRPT